MFGWDSVVNFVLYLQCLFLARFASGNSCSANLKQCSVATTSGRIVGDCSDSSIYTFFSIPYAQPPIGSLRLEDPISISQSSTTLVQGQNLPPYCPQLGNSNESEDCLYLNIWAPTSLSLSRPVLFWIHGGSNWYGSGSDPLFNGAKFANSQDVIIVTFNYRLGVLGFFDDGNDTNFAVKDTIMALKWIKDNISNFGGNPNLVTVFGNSSAGSIIRALMSTTEAAGLFNNVINQSDPEAYGFNKRAVSQDIISDYFLSLLNCKDKQCVKSLSIDAILSAQSQTIEWAFVEGESNLSINPAYTFGPVIDNELLHEDYSEYLAYGNLPNQVDMIIGFTRDEAGATINQELPSPVPNSYLVPTLDSLLGTARTTVLMNSNVYHLSNGTDAVRDLLVEFGTDYYWKCPIEYNTEMIVKYGRSKVFVYDLEKGIQYPTNAAYALCSGSAVCHQDDILLTFGNYGSGVDQTLQELSVSIQTAWAQFAKYGYPINCGNTRWTQASSENNLNVCQLGDSKTSSYVHKAQCNALDVIQYPFQLFSS